MNSEKHFKLDNFNNQIETRSNAKPKSLQQGAEQV